MNMDKTKIIKITTAVIIAVLAIIYYISNKQETNTYDNILTSDVVVENKIEENATEEKLKIKVYVTGEVNTPGVIELEEGARIQDAIEGAGGIKSEANLKEINLAYEVADGEKIYIPNLSEPSEESEEQSSTQRPSSAGSGSNSNSNGKININKATATELTSIPGIGASTAQKIITYREENGKFKTIEAIKNVSGIGDSKYNSMKDFISVK